MDFVKQLKYIGKWIAFKRSGLSQTELAKKAGISQQQLSVIEAGGNSTTLTFLKILTALGEKVELPVTDLININGLTPDHKPFDYF